jgi:hypothetical protein
MAAPAAVVRRQATAVDRLVAVLLLAMMAIGSLALWVAVPAGVMVALTPLSESHGYHLLVALVGVPVAMILTALLLLWLNGLYLRVTGHWRYDEEEDRPKRLRGPLEPLLAWSFLIALMALLFWFFFLPHGAPSPSPF